jgi:hypothetical protein
MVEEFRPSNDMAVSWKVFRLPRIRRQGPALRQPAAPRSLQDYRARGKFDSAQHVLD